MSTRLGTISSAFSAPRFVKLIAALGVAFTAACVRDTAETPATIDAFKASTEERLQEIVATDDTLPGASLRIIAPTLGLDWTAQAGLIEDGETPFTANHPLRISSVTKTFVAAAIMRLYEDGKIDLDAGISNYLKAEHTGIIRDSGHYNPDEITVRHLLTHTSGIIDFFFTEEYEAYEEKLANGELKPSKPVFEDQLGIAMRAGPPDLKPGERNSYTDTGYILLGAILEEQTGVSMAQAMRTLNGLDTLDLNSTWWAIFEEKPADALALPEQYFGELRASEWDTPTDDLYGGGGMIASSSDLAAFIYALFNGEVFKDDTTLDVMTSQFPVTDKLVENDSGSVYASHGLGKYPIGDSIAYGHGGWWGAVMAYAPEANIAIAANWLQQDHGEKGHKMAKEILGELIALQSRLTSESAATTQ
ncbi:MAG: serine hydrolase domain-containing protein [Pseudomonadota bacterium]